MKANSKGKVKERCNPAVVVMVVVDASAITRKPTHKYNAFRELRSYGRQNVWLCHMGRSAVDGTFGDFQDKVLALEPRIEGLSVQTATLRDASLQFGWEGPLLINGVEQATTGFKHYDSAYGEVDWPAIKMDIRFGEQIMRLEFED